MKIAVSTDMRTPLVEVILAELVQRGHEVFYHGPENLGDEIDWPQVTFEAVQRIATGEADEAIVMCWTGTGCSIVANKFEGIRAALCHDATTAKGARIWNHANVLALSLRVTSEAIVKEILDAWFDTPHSEDAWNLKQMKELASIEKKLKAE